MKYQVAIIGAGQLGSRHLQGVLSSKLSLVVHVMDITPSSLEMSKTRASEVKHSNELYFHTNIKGLPDNLDLVIVATNANVRATVTKSLLGSKKVKNLVLEKVLFQKIEDYDSILKLTESKGTKTWVNHPRRYQTLYKELKPKLTQIDQIDFNVYGQNWGACL